MTQGPLLQQHFYLKDQPEIRDRLSTFEFLEHEEELTESVCMYDKGGFWQ